MRETTSGSTPSPPPPASASPDSFTSTRRQPCPSPCRAMALSGDGAWPAAYRCTAPGSYASSPLSYAASIRASPNRSPTGRGKAPSSVSVTPGPPPLAVRSASGSGSADLETREPGHGNARTLQQQLHGLLGVLHGRLLEEHVVLEEAVEPALDDPGERRLRLALLAGGGLGDAPLAGDDVLGHLLAGDVEGAHGRDLHRRAPGGGQVVAGELDQHTDLRRQVRVAAVQIGGDRAVEDREPGQLEL